MATVRAPLFSPEVRGRIGQKVFRQWRNITTVAEGYCDAGQPPGAFSPPIGPAVAAWQALTFDQREQWEAYSSKLTRPMERLSPRTIPGYQQFLSHYCVAVDAGASISGGPPVTKTPSLPAGLSLSSPLPQKITLTWVADGDGDFLDIRGRLDWIASRKFREYRRVKLVVAALSLGTYSWTGLTTGKAVYIVARKIRTNGQAGEWGVVGPVLVS